MNGSSVRPNQTGSAEPFGQIGRNSSAELFGQTAEPRTYLKSIKNVRFFHEIGEIHCSRFNYELNFQLFMPTNITISLLHSYQEECVFLHEN